MCKVFLGVLMSCVQISLGMMRSDIMLDQHCDSGIYCNWKQVCAGGASLLLCNAGCPTQVELNTIASGFGWMGPASAILHRLVIKPTKLFMKMSEQLENCSTFLQKSFVSFICHLFFKTFYLITSYFLCNLCRNIFAKLGMLIIRLGENKTAAKP